HTAHSAKSTNCSYIILSGSMPPAGALRLAALVSLFSVSLLLSSDESPLLKPKVLIAIVARNAAHSLPYYLGCIENLQYPKERIAIWAATDHNVDNTTAMLREWLKAAQSRYHYVEWRPMEEPRSYTDEWGPKHWSPSRFNHLMKLRQAALKAARERWADYVLFADSDNLLTNPRVLDLMMAENRTLVAPMMESRSLYSNFWCGITPQVDKHRQYTQNQIIIKAYLLVHVQTMESSQFGSFQVCAKLIYYGKWPYVTNIPRSSHSSDVQMYVCNKEHYGFLPVPLKAHQSVKDEEESFTHTITEALIDHTVKPSQLLFVPPKPRDMMGFDEIFLINLKRRTDRRERMLNTLDILGLEVTVTEAVDGKALNSSKLQALGIEMMPDYKDPYSGRVLTRGEIGCFLSHHATWTEVVERGLQSVLVLEDDVRFEPRFKKRLQTIMEDVEKAQLDWDLIYVGRKRMQVAQPEVSVEGVDNLVVADYSYWTLGYALSQQGAQKLLSAQSFHKMLPVDEFLPIMFNKHPNAAYMTHFEPRDLLAFSVEPLLIYPTHYTGEPGYFSDTETSTIWDDEAVSTDWDRTHDPKTAQQGRIRPIAQNSVTGDTPPPAVRASRDEL
uniref:Collagen beta(1-O)galactosyltransferase 2 n=2 Tax=Astyanax mexicanus TaxID=7994 RepID=A0A8B9KRQ1_ASTMX